MCTAPNRPGTGAADVADGPGVGAADVVPGTCYYSHLMFRQRY